MSLPCLMDQVVDIFMKALDIGNLCRFKGLLGEQEMELSSRGRVETSKLN